MLALGRFKLLASVYVTYMLARGGFYTFTCTRASHYCGYPLRISLDRVPSTIYACCILHNKALDFKEVHASELEEPEGWPWQGRLPEIDAVSIEDIEAVEEATAQRAEEDFSTRSDAYIGRRGMQTRQELIDFVNVRVPRNCFLEVFNQMEELDKRSQGREQPL